MGAALTADTAPASDAHEPPAWSASAGEARCPHCAGTAFECVPVTLEPKGFAHAPMPPGQKMSRAFVVCAACRKIVSPY